jgi:hypothetical protein
MRKACLIAAILFSVLQSQAALKAAADVSGIAVSTRYVLTPGYDQLPDPGVVMKYDIANGQVTGRTELYRGIVAYAIISPDAQKVAFLKANNYYGADQKSIMVMSINGGKVEELISDVAGGCQGQFDVEARGESSGWIDWPLDLFLPGRGRNDSLLDADLEGECVDQTGSACPYHCQYRPHSSHRRGQPVQ